jgi:hypothetical protein
MKIRPIHRRQLFADDAQRSKRFTTNPDFSHERGNDQVARTLLPAGQSQHIGQAWSVTLSDALYFQCWLLPQKLPPGQIAGLEPVSQTCSIRPRRWRSLSPDKVAHWLMLVPTIGFDTRLHARARAEMSLGPAGVSARATPGRSV